MFSTEKTDFDRLKALEHARNLLRYVEGNPAFREPSPADMEAISVTLEVVSEALWNLLFSLGNSPKPHVKLPRRFRLLKYTIKRANSKASGKPQKLPAGYVSPTSKHED